MKPAPFRYHRPQSLGEALEMLSSEGAKLIAGGQSLAPMMNMRLVSPTELVDLNGIEGLDRIQESAGFVEIGAMTRHQALASSSLVRSFCPLLAEAAGTIGHYAIRTRGTLGGSLAHADPAAQIPLVAVTLGAQMVVKDRRGERIVPAAEFFLSLMTTTLAPDEIVVAARFPKAPAGARHAYEQFSRRSGDFAIVAVAAVLDEKALHIGVGGAEDKPLVFRQAATDAVSLARKIRDAVEPAENPRVPAIYRRELVEILVKRAVARCSSSS
ncbi:MAG TPA: xanthine dehydrogenase family protein subunit M [Burkholderiales bacterium]|nr:xanthine dehydrogenase family protein subunit M [Burkholderiales bacterium]